jgi:hypothetical protein
MKKTLLAFAAIAAFGAAQTTLAQTTPNSRDQAEVIISQIQADKRAVVLDAMNLSDAEVAKFTPIYDDYQAKMKGIMTRGTDLITKFASNYDSMTDDAAKSIMKDFFKVRDDRNALVKEYAKKMEKALPPTKVLRWVQVENKLNALLDFEAARLVPLS